MWGGFCGLRLLAGLVGVSQGVWWYTCGVDRLEALLILCSFPLAFVFFFIYAWMKSEDDED